MSVDDSRVVDAIGIEQQTGAVVLTISDHHDWLDTEHRRSLLRDKLNTYLAFIESGEIYDASPNSTGRSSKAMSANTLSCMASHCSAFLRASVRRMTQAQASSELGTFWPRR